MDTDFHPTTTASSVLLRIGNGAADADFAREVNRCTDAVVETNAKGRVTITIDIKPDEHHGLIFQAAVTSKIPKRAAAVAIMHRGPKGSLLTQQELMLGDHLDERPRAADLAAPTAKEERPGKVSGRLPVAPLAPKPKPAPLAGTTPSAGDEAGEKDQ